MRARLTALLTALLLSVGLGLSACSDDAAPKANRPSEPKATPTATAAPGESVPLLEPVWTAPTTAASPLSSLGDLGTDLWLMGTTVVTVERRSVTGHATGSGDQRWKVRLPGKVCASASRPGPSGVGIVVTGTARTEECVRITAIDLRSGKKLWAATTPYFCCGIDGAVGVGRTAVAVTGSCEGVARLDIRDGSLLELIPSPGQCADAVAGTRQMVRVLPHRGYEVRDVDSGRVLRTLLDPDAFIVNTVLAEEPLLVEAADDEGFVVVDLSGTTPRRIGRRLGTPYLAERVQTKRGIAVHFAATGVVQRYDAGRRDLVDAAPIDPASRLIGLRGARTLAIAAEPPAALATPEPLVVAVDPTNPDDPTYLGRLGTSRGATGSLEARDELLKGNRLYVVDAAGLSAYDIPKQGVLASAAGVPTPAVGEFSAHAARDLCPALKHSTLRGMGFQHLDPPATCDYDDLDAPGSPVLTITSVARPGDEDRTAIEVGQHWFRAETRSQMALQDSDNRDAKLPAASALSGLGDEAGVAYARNYRRIVVRVANVVLTLDLSTTGVRPGSARERELRRLLRRAAGELVAELERRTTP